MTSALRFPVLTNGAPDVEVAEATQLAATMFEVSGLITRLPSERDANFRVEALDGASYVLKVGNAVEDPCVTAFQTAALRHLGRKSLKVSVPAVRAARNGDDQVVTTIAAGTRHVVRLLSYLPGATMQGTAPSAAQTASLGATLASIGLALRDFRHPHACYDQPWDLEGAARLRPLLIHVPTAARACATRKLDLFEAEIQPQLAGLRRQVIHNDLNPHNVLVDPVESARIVGVLDFGDMVETRRVNDVAIAVAYMTGNPAQLDRIATFVGAYHAASPLASAEVEVLGDLIGVRLTMTLAIASWRASLHPENRDYILRNVPRAAAALADLERIGRPALRGRLREACAMA